MAERSGEIDRRIIYASLLIIMFLAIVLGLTQQETLSLIMIFLIVIVALGNIGYLYLKFRRREGK